MAESSGDITPNAVFPVSSGIFIHLAHRRLAFGAISPLNSASPVGQPNTAHGYTHATRSRPLAETGLRVKLRKAEACSTVCHGEKEENHSFRSLTSEIRFLISESLS